MLTTFLLPSPGISLLLHRCEERTVCLDHWEILITTQALHSQARAASHNDTGRRVEETKQTMCQSQVDADHPLHSDLSHISSGSSHMFSTNPSFLGSSPDPTTPTKPPFCHPLDRPLVGSLLAHVRLHCPLL